MPQFNLFKIIPDNIKAFVRRISTKTNPTELAPNKSHSINIQPDANGEYTIELPMIQGETRIIYHNNGNVILDIKSNKTELLIKGTTTEQINIFSEIKAEQFLVEMVGNICFSSKVNVKSLFFVKAKSIYFVDDVRSEKKIELYAEQLLGLKAPIQADSLKIQANYLFQESQCHAVDVDIKAQLVQNKAKYHLQAKTLTLVCKQLEHDGMLDLTQKLFMGCGVTVLGSQSKLKVRGESYIAVHSVHLLANAHVNIQCAALNDTNAFVVSESQNCANTSDFIAENLNYQCCKLVVDGELSFMNAKLTLNEIFQSGSVALNQCTLNMNVYKQKLGATSTFRHATMSVHTMGGDCLSNVFDNCTMKGDIAHFLSGKIIITANSQLNFNLECILHERAEAEIKNSLLSSSGFVSLHGQVQSFDASQIHAAWIKSTHARSKYENTRFRASEQIEMRSATLLKSTTLRATTVEIKQSVIMNEAGVFARNLLMDVASADIKTSSIAANLMEIQGGTIEDSVCVKMSKINCEIVKVSKHVTLHDSFLFCLDKDNTHNQINHKLKLINSKIISDNQLTINKNAELNLGQNSAVIAPLCANRGRVVASTSDLRFKTVLQENAVLDLENTSCLIVDQDVFSENSKSKLADSGLVAHNVYDDHVLEMTDGSLIAVTNNLVSQTFTSKKSTTQFVSFYAKGLSTLEQSVLSGDAIKVFNQFSVVKGSSVDLKQAFEVLQDGNALIHSADFSAKNVAVLGSVQINQSQVKLEESFEVLSTGIVQVDLSKLTAQNMIVNGNHTAKNSQIELQGDYNVDYDGMDKLISCYVEISNMSVAGQSAIDDHSIVKVKNAIKVKFSGNQIIDSSILKTNKLFVDGKQKNLDGLLLVSDTVDTEHGSSIKLIGSAGLQTRNFNLLGQLTVEYGENHLVSPMLNVSERFSVAHLGQIEGSAANVVTKKFNNAGTISLKTLNMECARGHNTGRMNIKSACFRGKSFINRGSIASDRLFLGFDYGVVNFTGHISANNATIHANLFNLFSAITVKEQLTVNGFFNVNLGGGIVANNYANNSLISANIGLIFPNFSANKKYIFSIQNLKSFFKTTISTVMPNISSILNLASVALQVKPISKATYKFVTDLNKQQIKSLRTHEIMPIICQAKDLVMYGMSVVSSSTNVCSDLNRFLNVDTPSTSAPFNLAHTFLNFTSKALPLFAGNHSDTSLLTFNAGFNSPAAYHSMSITHVNVGLISALSHHVETKQLINFGCHTAQSAAIFASHANNMGAIVLNSAQLRIDTLQQYKKLKINNGSVNINKFSSRAASQTSYKNTVVIGNDHVLQGEFTAQNVYAQLDTLKMSGNQVLENSKFKTNHELIVSQKTNQQISGYVEFESAEKLIYYASATLKDDKSAVSLKSRTLEATKGNISGAGVAILDFENGDVRGLHATMATLYLKTNALENQDDFIRGIGAYATIAPTSRLMFETRKQIVIDKQFSDTRNIEMHFIGHSIDVLIQLHRQHALSLTSTVDSINTYADIDAAAIHLDSANHIHLHGRKHHAKSIFSARAKYNIYGKHAGATAQEIILSAGNNSYLQGSQWHATNYFESYSGNKVFLQGAKNGSRYDKTVIESGLGVGHDDVAVLIVAKDKPRTGYTEISSLGHNVIDGKNGISLDAQIGVQERKSHRCNGIRKKSTTTTTEMAYTTTIISKLGSNYFISEEGKLDTHGANLLSPLGKNNAHVKGDITQHGVLLTEKTKIERKYLGVFKMKSSKQDESFVSDVLYDQGTIFRSDEGKHYNTGAQFLGEGKVEIYTKYGSTNARQILNHHSTENTISFGASCFGSETAKQLVNGNLKAAIINLLREDPLLDSAIELLQSQTVCQGVTNTSNLLINSYNSAYDLAKAINNDTFKETFLTRLGLGDAEGFNPNVHATFGMVRHKSHHQTLSEGGIYKEFDFVCPQGDVTFANGYTVQAAKGSITAKKLNLYGAKLKSSRQSKGVNVTLTGTSKQGVSDVSVGCHYSKSSETTWVYQETDVGELTLELSSGIWNVDAAKVDVNMLHIIGILKELNVISRQNSFKEFGCSFDIHTNGVVSGSVNYSTSKQASEISGIRVYGVANNFNPIQFNNVGGYVSTVNADDFKPLITHEQHLRDKNHGFSLSSSFTLSKKSDADVAIQTKTMGGRYHNYKADRRAQIHSGHGPLDLRPVVKRDFDTGECQVQIPSSFKNIARANEEINKAISSYFPAPQEEFVMPTILIPQPVALPAQDEPINEEHGLVHASVFGSLTFFIDPVVDMAHLLWDAATLVGAYHPENQDLFEGMNPLTLPGVEQSASNMSNRMIGIIEGVEHCITTLAVAGNEEHLELTYGVAALIGDDKTAARRSELLDNSRKELVDRSGINEFLKLSPYEQTYYTAKFLTGLLFAPTVQGCKILNNLYKYNQSIKPPVFMTRKTKDMRPEIKPIILKGDQLAELASIPSTNSRMIKYVVDEKGRLTLCKEWASESRIIDGKIWTRNNVPLRHHEIIPGMDCGKGVHAAGDGVVTRAGDLLIDNCSGHFLPDIKLFPNGNYEAMLVKKIRQSGFKGQIKFKDVSCEFENLHLSGTKPKTIVVYRPDNEAFIKLCYGLSMKNTVKMHSFFAQKKMNPDHNSHLRSRGNTLK